MIELLAQSSSDSAAGMAALAAFGVVYAIVICVMVAFYVLIAYMIVKKAGYNPWLALLILVPLVNFVMLIIFAFSEWPVLRAARGAQGGGTYPGGYTGGTAATGYLGAGGTTTPGTTITPQ